MRIRFITILALISWLCIGQPAHAVTVDGTSVTGVSQDSGGVGAVGWLSSIVKNVRLIATSVAGTLTVQFVSAQHVIIDSVTGTIAATQSGTWNIGSITTLPAITFASAQHIIADASSAVIGHVVVDSGSVSISGPVPNPTATPAATLTQTASSASSVTILAANSAANGWTICNSSTAIAYVAKAATSTSSAYTIAMPPAGTVPTCYTEFGPQTYRGILTAIWASANGNMIVTEW